MAIAIWSILIGLVLVVIGIVIVMFYDRSVPKTDTNKTPVYGTAAGFIIVGSLTLIITLWLVLSPSEAVVYR